MLTKQPSPGARNATEQAAPPRAGGRMLPAALQTLITAILARLFDRLEALLRLWQSGTLPIPQPRRPTPHNAAPLLTPQPAHHPASTTARTRSTPLANPCRPCVEPCPPAARAASIRPRHPVQLACRRTAANPPRVPRRAARDPPRPKSPSIRHRLSMLILIRYRINKQSTRLDTTSPQQEPRPNAHREPPQCPPPPTAATPFQITS